MMPRYRLYFVCGMTLWWWITAGAVVTQAQTSSPQPEDPLVRLAKRLTAEALKTPRSPQTPGTQTLPGTSPATPVVPAIPQIPRTPTASQARRRASSPSQSHQAKTTSVVISPTESLPLGRVTQNKTEQPVGGGGISESSGIAGGVGGWILNTLTALGVVIGLIFLLRWGLTRLSGRTTAIRAGSVIHVLSRTSLGQRNQVLLLQLGQRILVVGDSNGRLATLSEISEPQEVASLLATIDARKPNSITRGFSELLKGEDAAHDDVSFEESEHTVDRVRDELSGLLSRIRRMGGGDSS